LNLKRRVSFFNAVFNLRCDIVTIYGRRRLCGTISQFVDRDLVFCNVLAHGTINSITAFFDIFLCGVIFVFVLFFFGFDFTILDFYGSIVQCLYIIWDIFDAKCTATSFINACTSIFGVNRNIDIFVTGVVTIFVNTLSFGRSLGLDITKCFLIVTNCAPIRLSL